MTNASDPPPLPTSAPQPSPAPRQEPLPVMSYATPGPPANRAAAWSFVFGLLFFIPLAAPGVVAIVFGRRGLKAAEEQAAGRARLARAGIVLGAVNLVLSLAFAAWLPFGLIKARQQAQAVACAANLRQVGMAAMIYANQNRGFLPPTLDHLAAIVPGAAGTRMLTCPACGTNPAKPPVYVGPTVSSHYHLVPPAPRVTLVKRPARAVLAYELPANHDNRGMNVLFCDGHVEFIGGAAVPKIAAELKAGQNPPPSLP